MKKVFTAALVMLLAMGGLNAQNNFRGIVKYEMTSTGTEFIPIPEDQKVVEVKVYDSKVANGQTLQNGLKLTVAADYSQYIAYLAAQDIELESYTGDGKFLVKDESTKESLDSLYIEDKEPGHFYFEMTNETKDILGFTAKKQIMHRYDAEDVDHPAECWVSEQIGPEYCLIFGGMKGFPLVFTQQVGEGKAVTFTAIEIVKGKVKEAEMLPPAGYKDASQEELDQFMKEMKDAFELLED